ncbi:MAG: aliphatic sulfonate ABC transporter permease SsuC [Deltaproteobacteria bacterium]|nr:aliphatic sulfonate ABC transporter permease SsuC [Deltaproteobacteria bacterium]
MNAKWKRSAAARLLPWVVPSLLVAAWQLASQCGYLPARILPAPTAVLGAAIRLSKSGELFEHIRISALRAALGFVLGGVIGLGLGVLSGVFSLAEDLLDSSVQMIRNIPHLALLPLVILWFGIDESAKIVLVGLGVFFPIYINTFHGIRNTDPHLLEMARVYGLKGFGLFREVIFPGALPSIMVGVRYALGITWLTLIVAETIATTSGIGYLAMNAREFMQTDIVVLAILLYALLGKLSDSATRLLERKLLSWHPAYRAA